MRHVAYSTNDDGESPLAMAISVTTAEDAWFCGHKSRIRLGGGIYAGSGGRILDIDGAYAVVNRDYGASIPAEAVHHGDGHQFRGESKTAAAAIETDEADKKVNRNREENGEYYGHLRLLSAISAATVVPASCSVPSEKWPLRRKKSCCGGGFFKRKPRPSLSNVVEIYEHGSVVASVLSKEKLLVSEHRKRRGSDADQTSKTIESCGGVARNTSDEATFTVAGDVTSLISVSKPTAYIDAAAANNRRLLSSACDLREIQSCGYSDPVKSRGASSRSWYADRCAETEVYLDKVGFPKENGNDVGKWSRRETFDSLPEDKDGGFGEINAVSEERVVLLERSSSVPYDDALSTPPARKTVSVENNGRTRNSVPSAVYSTTTSSRSKLSKWSKSKIDLLVPSLKSLVTMTTNKLSTSRPANLNYWRNSNFNDSNSFSRSRFDIRALGASSASSFRRNVSLNNVTRDDRVDQLKNVSSDDIAEMCLLKKKLRKCNTVLTLSSCVSRNVITAAPSASGVVHVEPLKPVNRLRICPSNHDMIQPSRLCSRCSSLLSMASSSRYSLNSTYGFVPISVSGVLCKVCLNEVPLKDSWTLQHCECSYCVDCVRSYVEFEINQGAYSISCPDAQCEKKGIILLEEIESLVSLDCIQKHKRYRLNNEVEMDKSRTWCPRAGCETVCTLCSTDRCSPQSVHCPSCNMDFCSNCRVVWHPNSPCKSEEMIPGVTFDSELIKCCPMCSVPIEKDEGCAQMLCKRCKHVFCWYCLASLDDDFLLRHYDKGPCKNKLGHSRASVIWHRTQVISIFAGFGILLLIASPLLLLAAPCIVCCKCRVCTTDSRLDSDDDSPEAPELQLNADVSGDQEAVDAWKV